MSCEVSFDKSISYKNSFSADDEASFSTISTTELIDARFNGISILGGVAYDAAFAEIESRLSETFPENFRKIDSTIESILSTKGPAVEVGGPTSNVLGTGYKTPLLSPDNSAKKVFISNLYPCKNKFDLIIDAKNLPFRSGSLGLIMASCLPNNAKSSFFDQTFDHLERGGFLQFNRGDSLDLYHALTLGFELKDYTRRLPQHAGEVVLHSFIAQKPQS